MKRTLTVEAPKITSQFQDALQKPRQNWVEELREYRFITPLWGGGAIANKVDDSMPVSGKGIRGQLRFWWRATRGGSYDSLPKLQEAENKLWGAAAGKAETGNDEKRNAKRPDRVQLQIEILDPGTNNNLPRIPEYAAFPLNPDENQLKRLYGEEKKRERRRLREENNQRSLRHGIRFRLTVTFPDEPQIRRDVEAALWAWETFGGYGARTRRGFGAIERIDGGDTPTDATPDSVRNWILSKLQDENFVSVASSSPDLSSLPRLSASVNFKVGKTGSANKVWNDLIGALRDFRQNQRPGAGTNHPGRTDWCDADAVRYHVLPRNGAGIGHTPRAGLARKFPRAAFGLPIIFHFKDQDDPREDATLQGAQHDRLGSPLILRPLACGEDKNRQCVGIALVLEAPLEPQGGLNLRWGSQSASVQRALDVAEAGFAPLKGNPSLGIVNNPDVLDAFLKTL